ncbi:hypothetical protein TNIN_471461 [Trichonephila inaurata madagascariensis]|uniref:Uncharacterized protein n=1 Tax=Trichonephila inaurata madagascariensis TaxID=2747483 RepID=A0A8X7C1D2_9ARAC|nr:hypothetical protein TNIN_471461 [Trichonephila inaurata madagascariensis]
MQMILVFIFASIAASWADTVKTRNPMMNPGLFQGDMLVANPSNDRNAVPLDSQRWPEQKSLMSSMSHSHRL